MKNWVVVVIKKQNWTPSFLPDKVYGPMTRAEADSLYQAWAEAYKKTDSIGIPVVKELSNSEEGMKLVRGTPESEDRI